MRSWDVDGVVDFFKANDAAGLAKIMLDNSVDGADLLSFAAAASLQEDLRVTPFAARKILKVRDGYLQRPVP